MLGKKKIAIRPNGWTEEMLSDFLRDSPNSDNLSNYILLITGAQRKVSVCETGIYEEVKFYGRIGSPEKSDLQFVRVIIDAFEGLDELKRRVKIGYEESLPLESMGYLRLNNHWERNDTITPTLEINLLGGKCLQSELISSLSITKQFGNTYLPLWIWVDVGSMHDKSPAEVMEVKYGNFPLIEKCRFQQAIDLSGNVTQDDMLF